MSEFGHLRGLHDRVGGLFAIGVLRSVAANLISQLYSVLGC